MECHFSYPYILVKEESTVTNSNIRLAFLPQHHQIWPEPLCAVRWLSPATLLMTYATICIIIAAFVQYDSQKVQSVWTVDCERWTVNCGLWTVDCELWTVNCERWTVNCERWTMNCGLWTVDCEQPMKRGSAPSRTSRFVCFLSLKRPDRLWRPPKLLIKDFSKYQLSAQFF